MPKFHVIFQHRSFFKRQCAFHADPMLDIFLRNLLLLHTLTGLIQRRYVHFHILNFHYTHLQLKLRKPSHTEVRMQR